jgi:hypothetical protein
LILARHCLSIHAAGDNPHTTTRNQPLPEVWNEPGKEVFLRTLRAAPILGEEAPIDHRQDMEVAHWLVPWLESLPEAPLQTGQNSVAHNE